MKKIPNFITSLNLAAGFFAIISAASGDLVTASWLILSAMIFDFLDGFSARLLKAYSDIGKELDSLADVVSFGVAPAMIILHLLADSLSLSGPFSFNGVSDLKTTLIMVTPVFMPVFAALRLAIFNIDSTQAKVFKGLPTPANALAVISIVIAGHYSNSALINSLMGSTLFLIVFTLILSFIMVSRITLLSMKVSDLKIKGNEGRFILAGLVMVSFIILGIQAAPLIIPFYIIASLLSLFF
jgi:CDP-diacylglycerol--serine O-phosphatidyltransferase